MERWLVLVAQRVLPLPHRPDRRRDVHARGPVPRRVRAAGRRCERARFHGGRGRGHMARHRDEARNRRGVGHCRPQDGVSAAGRGAAVHVHGRLCEGWTDADLRRCRVRSRRRGAAEPPHGDVRARWWRRTISWSLASPTRPRCSASASGPPTSSIGTASCAGSRSAGTSRCGPIPVTSSAPCARCFVTPGQGEVVGGNSGQRKPRAYTGVRATSRLERPARSHADRCLGGGMLDHADRAGGEPQGIGPRGMPSARRSVDATARALLRAGASRAVPDHAPRGDWSDGEGGGGLRADGPLAVFGYFFCQ